MDTGRVDTGAPELEGLTAWKESLQARADQLRDEIRARQGDLAQVEERLSLVTKLIDVEIRVQAGTPASNSAHTLTSPSEAPRRVAAGDLEQAVEDVLREAGSPLHISTIRESLEAQGVRIPGRGDDANIIVRLRRSDDRFTRTARGTYGLAEWGIPALVSKTRKRRRTTR